MKTIRNSRTYFYSDSLIRNLKYSFCICFNKLKDSSTYIICDVIYILVRVCVCVCICANTCMHAYILCICMTCTHLCVGRSIFRFLCCSPTAAAYFAALKKVEQTERVLATGFNCFLCCSASCCLLYALVNYIANGCSSTHMLNCINQS